MKHLLLAIFTLILIELVTFGCANPKTPTGGPKDTIPPVILNSTPKNQSINFNDKTVELSFNEPINADKLKQNLIITPTSEFSYKALVKKNTLTLILDESLADSTTYTFNFFDGVTDITEKNPSDNLVLAFSTGSYIDSISVSGKVYDIINENPLSKITIGLYKQTDTLNFTIDKPTYFINSDDEGFFNIQNIKSGEYRLLVFNDENKNLLFDPSIENHGFLRGILSLDSINIDSLNIPLLELDVSELSFLTGRPSSHYFDIRYSKPLVTYDIASELNKPVYSKLTEDQDAIRVYNINMLADSTRLVVTAFDTLASFTTDTLYAIFRSSSKKLNALSTQITPKTNSVYFPDETISISFSKPITTITDSAFLEFRIDSLISFDLPVKGLSMNQQNTLITFRTTIEQQQIKDTINSYLSQHHVDTLNIDTTQLITNNRLNKHNSNSFTIYLKTGTFISVESDTTTEIAQTYQFPNTETFGSINVTIDNPASSYIVQIMSAQKVVRSQKNCLDCKFDFIKPGKYWTRILLDTNEDHVWSPGNINYDIQPEPIIYFHEETTLRANWEVALNYSLLITR